MNNNNNTTTTEYPLKDPAEEVTPFLSDLITRQLKKTKYGDECGLYAAYEKNIKTSPNGCFGFFYQSYASVRAMRLMVQKDPVWIPYEKAMKTFPRSSSSSAEYALSYQKNTIPLWIRIADQKEDCATMASFKKELEYHEWSLYYTVSNSEVVYQELAAWHNKRVESSSKTAGVSSLCKETTDGTTFLRATGAQAIDLLRPHMLRSIYPEKEDCEEGCTIAFLVIPEDPQKRKAWAELDKQARTESQAMDADSRTAFLGTLIKIGDACNGPVRIGERVLHSIGTQSALSTHNEDCY